jgi:hypothetical protein
VSPLQRGSLEAQQVDARAPLDARRGCEREVVEAVAKAGDRGLLLCLPEICGAGLGLGDVWGRVLRGEVSPIACELHDLSGALDTLA